MNVESMVGQVNALRSHVVDCLDQSKRSEDYFPGEEEIARIHSRYSRLRTALMSSFPEVFWDLMEFEADDTDNDLLGELVRELNYISEAAEKLRDQSIPVSGQVYESDFGDNTPFSSEERLRIGEQLDELKNYMIQIVSKQAEVSGSKEEFKAALHDIQSDISYVKEAASKFGRREWKGIFVNTMISLFIAVGFDDEARQGVAALMGRIIRMIRQTQLYLEGS